MTRQTSSPPLIILLDLLFILIFILLITKKNQIEIDIPKDKLFQGAILIYKNDGLKYIMNQTTKQADGIWRGRPNGITFFDECHIQCKEYDNKYKNNLYIYYPDNLVNELSNRIFIALHTDEFNCKNLKFEIKSNGIIDIEKLKIDNPCVKNIPGFIEK